MVYYGLPGAHDHGSISAIIVDYKLFMAEHDTPALCVVSVNEQTLTISFPNNISNFLFS